MKLKALVASFVCSVAFIAASNLYAQDAASSAAPQTPAQTVKVECTFYVSCFSGTTCSCEQRETHGYWKNSEMTELKVSGDITLDADGAGKFNTVIKPDALSVDESFSIYAVIQKFPVDLDEPQYSDKYTFNLAIEHADANGARIGGAASLSVMGQSRSSSADGILSFQGKPVKMIPGQNYSFIYSLACGLR